MTAAASATGTGNECLERAPQHQMPLHNAPSLQDLLALKRQRRSLDDSTPEPQQAAPAAPLPVSEERQSPDDDAVCAAAPGGRGSGEAADPAAAPRTSAFLSAPTFAAPLLPGVPGEPMSGYFQRLRQSLAASAADPSQPQPAPELRAVAFPQLDGVYLHKRPIRAPNGASPLAVCGSVLHHVVVLVKQGPLLHSLDFGPANGADVTANILEQAPPKKVMATTAASGDGAPGAAQDELPYLYLGAPACGVDHPLVQQLVSFAESRPYHALTNNCIHFADALIRLMTAGAVRAAPLLYDLTCGSVPAVDNPMLLMMQLMLRMTWFVVVDGSPLTAAFLEHCRACGWREEQPQGQGNDPRVATADVAEDRDNNGAGSDATAAPGNATAAPAVEPAPSAVGPVAVGASDRCSGEEPASGSAAGGECSTPGPEQQQQQQQQQQGSGGAAHQDEGERWQEQENDHALCGAEAAVA